MIVGVTNSAELGSKLVVMKKRKNYTSGFKTKVVLEALQERETIQEIGKKYEVHPNQISI
jgi:transposase-like protein